MSSNVVPVILDQGLIDALEVVVDELAWVAVDQRELTSSELETLERVFDALEDARWVGFSMGRITAKRPWQTLSPEGAGPCPD